MRTIVHISDLHFGKHDPRTLGPLAAIARERRPDVIAVSGDLTQRAKESEFREARAFLETLPGPQIVVPGNHDVPLFDVYRRLFAPLARYRRIISDDVEPFLADGEIAVMGLNTARSLTWKSGRLNDEQLERVRTRLSPLPNSLVKIVVTHHPFDLPPGGDDDDLVGRAHRAMKVFAQAGADVFLSGHMHIGATSRTADRYRIDGHSALVIHAGTATSTRHRGETNSFNVLTVERAAISIERFVWDPLAERFEGSPPERHLKGAAGWSGVAEEARVLRG